MKKPNKILIVDDAEINRSMLTDMLSDNYTILEAANGLQAVALLSKHHATISLVLLDIVMPKMDGFEVLAAMNRSEWINSIPVIMISAEKSPLLIDHAYDLGAVEYISRPFDPSTVNRRVKNTIMLYSKQKRLEDMLTEQLIQKEKSNLIMVEILSHIVEFRNGESGLHVLHIRVVTETILKHLVQMTDQYKLNPSDISLIANASALHDIGKISISERILNKPGKLTPEEYAEMQKHSAIGAQMLEDISYYKSEKLVQVARDICRWHHERYDGNGYPDGLAGENIPISAQVVALADVYDALTNERVYKPAYSHEQAIEMILNGECGIFNPLLLNCLKEVGSYLSETLTVRSTEKISKKELQNMTKNLLQNDNVSNRTLALLEQERTKYQFFASMSKEIQFEYIRDSDILTMSEWGAAHLGVPEIIAHPRESEELFKVFSKEDYKNLQEQIYAVQPDNPIVQQNYCLNVRNQPRWYKVIARPLWVEAESNELTGIIGKFTDVHEEQLELAHLKQAATHDSLTSLYNRDYARQSIKAALDEGQKDGKKFVLLLFDLDNFKTANDRFGHVFGDHVLQAVAENMNKAIGTISDTGAIGNTGAIAARVGGDEFLLFMEYRDSVGDYVKHFYEKIPGQYLNFKIELSMGAALAPQNADDYESLFHHADQALYAAKQNGKNHFCFYDDSMQNLLSVLSPIDA